MSLLDRTEEDDWVGYRRSFPVLRVGGNLPKTGFVYKGELFGTCFGIGGEYMITAGHVARGIPTEGVDGAVVALTNPATGYIAAPVVKVDPLQRDLAILKVQYLQSNHVDFFTRHKWCARPLRPLDDVQSYGFAWGEQLIGGHVFGVQRAFKGYVVAARTGWELPASSETPFPVYELSFPAPRGLSGSPLLNADSIPTVFGVVIGNSETKMLVHASSDVEASAKERITTEHYETLTLGIAVRSEAILPLESTLLGCTVEKHLERHGLLAVQ